MIEKILAENENSPVKKQRLEFYILHVNNSFLCTMHKSEETVQRQHEMHKLVHMNNKSGARHQSERTK